MLDGELDRSLPNPIPVTDGIGIAILTMLELIAVWWVVQVWRERGESLVSRIFWTVVTLVPLLGLLAHAVWRNPPGPPSDSTDRRAT